MAHSVSHSWREQWISDRTQGCVQSCLSDPVLCTVLYLPRLGVTPPPFRGLPSLHFFSSLRRRLSVSGAFPESSLSDPTTTSSATVAASGPLSLHPNVVFNPTSTPAVSTNCSLIPHGAPCTLPPTQPSHHAHLLGFPERGVSAQHSYPDCSCLYLPFPCFLV